MTKEFDIRNAEVMNRETRKAGCYNRPVVSVTDETTQLRVSLFTRMLNFIKSMFSDDYANLK